MKCSNVRKEIERMAYRHDPDAGPEVYRHIGSCKDCARHLEETRLVAGRIAGMRQREPILKDPGGLTDNIMKAIQMRSQEIQSGRTEKSGKSPVISIFQRLTAAATVCLFLVFGYEQYIVVDKISRLEKQNVSISGRPQYQGALKLNKVIRFLSSDPEILNKYQEASTIRKNPRDLLKAAIYLDVAGITPEALKMINSNDLNNSKSLFMSVMKKFDSPQNTLQR